MGYKFFKIASQILQFFDTSINTSYTTEISLKFFLEIDFTDQYYIQTHNIVKIAN